MLEQHPTTLENLPTETRIHVRMTSKDERKTFARGRNGIWVRFKDASCFDPDDYTADMLAHLDLPVADVDTETDMALIRFPDVAAALAERDGLDPSSSRYLQAAAAFTNPALVLVVPVERFEILDPAA